MSSQFPKPIFVSKLNAARRQLDMAIRMWFNGDDPVSTHTLAHASYEIIHFVSKNRKRTQDLLFDSDLVKEEYRKDFIRWLKGPGNFFKHANKDPNNRIEFHPVLTELFISSSISGLTLAGEQINDTESAFLVWLQIHRPDWIAPEYREAFVNRVPVENIDGARHIPKNEFLKAFITTYARSRS